MPPIAVATAAAATDGLDLDLFRYVIAFGAGAFPVGLLVARLCETKKKPRPPSRHGRLRTLTMIQEVPDDSTP